MNREKPLRQHQFPQMPLSVVHRTEGRDNNGQRFQRLFNAAALQPEESGDTCLNRSPDEATASVSDLVSIESEAYAKGFRNGEQDGKEAAGNRIQQAVDALTRAAEDLKRLQQTLSENSEERLVELALAIGRKVVGYEIVSNREVVVNVAREALKSVGNLQEVTLKLNPQDLRFLEENQMSIAQLAPHISDVYVEASDSIEQGGCVIDSACGKVDAQIDNQLKLIEKAFQRELGNRSETET